MLKAEATAFIQAEIEKGTPESEILEVLMSQDKLGLNKPTEQLAKSWIEQAKEVDAPKVNISENQPKIEAEKPKNNSQSGDNYEEWNMRIVRGENGIIKELIPSHKIKDLYLDDEVAEFLNRTISISGKGYTVKYIKKTEV